MTRSDRIFGSSKTVAMLRSDKIEAGMAELGRALEKEIKRQDRAVKRAKKPARPATKRRVKHG